MDTNAEALTYRVTSGTGPRMGRKKEFTESIRLPLAAGTLARIETVLGLEEPRLDMIRVAIEREIARREAEGVGPIANQGSPAREP